MTTEIAAQVRELLAGPRPLPIVRAGDPVLRRPAAEVDDQLPSELLAELIMAMRETIHEAPGVGVAAPQIGLGLKLAVIEDLAVPELAEERERYPLPFFVIINPRYEPIGDRRAVFFEGCLSVPGYQAVVDRAADVRLHYQDPDLRPSVREFSGWQARIVQHETDHLDGILYLDKAFSRSLTANDQYATRWAGLPVDVARHELKF